MNTGNFDLEALLRAIGMGMGIGLIAAATGYFVMRKRTEWSQWRPVLIMGTVGLVLLLTAVIYYAWPNLIVVPALDNLSQAEAENILVKHNLVPQGKPQYAVGVENGRVVPHSQSPSYGLSVRPGTVVVFAISERDETPKLSSNSSINLSVLLFQPKGGEKALCSRGGDNVYKFEVNGTSSGLSPNGYGLLLWMRPVRPPSETPGWYLQRPPANGIDRVEADGAWIGVAQIGNAQWPPHDGDILDIAVSIADKNTISNLMAEPGVLIRNQPVGMKIQTALGIVVTVNR